MGKSSLGKARAFEAAAHRPHALDDGSERAIQVLRGLLAAIGALGHRHALPVALPAVGRGADPRVQGAPVIGGPPQRQADLEQAAAEPLEQLARVGGEPSLAQEPVHGRNGLFRLLWLLYGQLGGLGHSLLR